MPGAPTGVTAVGGNTTAQVSWTAPASNGGSAITGYVITVSPGGAVVNVGNVTSSSVSGLTNGTSYTFTVAAVNAAGTGPASSPSNAGVPAPCRAPRRGSPPRRGSSRPPSRGRRRQPASPPTPPRQPRRGDVHVDDRSAELRGRRPHRRHLVHRHRHRHQRRWHRSGLGGVQRRRDVVGCRLPRRHALPGARLPHRGGRLRRARGEHRFKIIKAKPYEMALRVPLIIRGPGFAAGATNRDLVTLADLAPTIVDLAGATPGRVMDGWSLVPGRQTADQIGQRALLMEYGPLDNRPTYKSVRDRRWKYIEWSTGDRELYDLWNDPFELQNRAGNPDYRLAEWLMRRRWLALAGCAGASCQAGPPAF